MPLLSIRVFGEASAELLLPVVLKQTEEGCYNDRTQLRNIIMSQDYSTKNCQEDYDASHDAAETYAFVLWWRPPTYSQSGICTALCAVGRIVNRTVVTTVQRICISSLIIDDISTATKISITVLSPKITELFNTTSFWNHHLYHEVFVEDSFVLDNEKLFLFQLL